MGVVETLTLALGASWASGINLYATVLMLGGMDAFGLIDLPPELQSLSSFWVLAAALGLYAIEFLADKIPGVDSVWDAIHTFIRIPAGAMLAAGAVGGMGGLDGLSNEATVIAALIGGGAISAASHATKAGGRAMINTSPEPVTNWIASFFEDVLVFVGIAFAVVKPVVFLIGFGIFVLILIWLLPKIWRGIRSVFGNARHPVRAAQAVRAGNATGEPPLPPPDSQA